ncbi:hypothetical protein FLAG1_08581 [Fusarium langsethiae]|uniref:DUF6536 domain-containing protein n=1 Tax=Fusarium langsethiae TaxID=179993 RepID=A0A0M9ES93_FUSLA|nr:hypothetical protein FLAG1_08581 [Fusarium langsethiae]GKU08207.1 unnamed protein product [Fusarium langsethiae]GKU21997.1 unnamed protein product [Fusarium langsethiae]
MAPYSGWKRTAVYLTSLVATLTTFLVVMLFVSLFALERDDDSRAEGSNRGDALGQSILHRGNCDITAKANLWIHLAINIIGTGVLASSNFFMQSLVAPTRKEVDAAHKTGQWLEIGVQSLKNVRFLNWRKALFWSLFSLSSVPLHLVFNGCVLESKGTNGFTLFLGTESLIRGSWKGQAPIATSLAREYTDEVLQGNDCDGWRNMKHVNESIATNSWERIDFSECMERYNDPEKSLIHYRHLIMVIYDYEDEGRNSTNGWKLSQVYKNTTNMTDIDTVNPLWAVDAFARTGNVNALDNGPIAPSLKRYPSSGSRYLGLYNGHVWILKGLPTILDTSSGILVMDPSTYKPEYRVMQVGHCWSEKLRVWGNENPLMTPGDAIASFIARPDEETRGMCTLSLEDLKRPPASPGLVVGDTTRGYKLLQGPRQWHTTSARKFGKALPRSIWIVSSLLIGSSLVVAGTMLGISLREQSLADARFAHSPLNEDVRNESLENLALLPLTMVANLPQLILSTCYLAYNGLFTRMLAEFEWSKYSVEFKSLRVTEPKGSQNSTYRLQLPYRFSIPLIFVSIALHWLYSNCIYVSNYEAYNPVYPHTKYVTIGLQFSSKAILTSFVISVCVAITPLFLANVKLPGIIVVSGGNSAVISAACHYPSRKLKSLSRATSRNSSSGIEYDNMSARLIVDEDADELEDVARKKVKWGRLSMGKSEESRVGHLGFGTEDQDVGRPVEGEHYSGL